MATPMLQATRRCGSRVEFSAMTAKTTSPSSRYLRPSLRGIILHCGGKIDETRTRFCEAIPASRRASSKEVRRSLCLPTPLVKKIFFGTMLFPNFYVASVSSKSVISVQVTRMSLSHPGGLEGENPAISSKVYGRGGGVAGERGGRRLRVGFAEMVLRGLG